LSSRTRRLLPLLAAALLVGLLATAAVAPARSSSGSGHRISEHCSDNEYSAWDEQWLMMSIEGDHFEIQGGKLAQSKGEHQVIRDLGARLLKDHTKTLADAVKVAHELGIPVPGEPSPTQQWELNVLSTFHGTKFDQWYADLEVRDHIQDIMEAQDEVDQGCNPKVREDARTDLPILRTHLQLARHAQSVVGKPPSASGV
jgi:putative membrane protein